MKEQIIQQLHCEFLPYEFCSYSVVIPDWVFILVGCLFLAPVLLWVSWNFILEMKRPRPRWLNVTAFLGFIYTVVIPIIGLINWNMSLK